MTRDARYRDFGTPRRGADRGLCAGGGRIRTPWLGTSRSRRNTIHTAVPMMIATAPASAAKPQITHSILRPFGICHV
ncbi:MAG: hypothetical protein RIB61_00960 [Roseicyclus sp.]